jgi:hypothetical protein
MTAANRKASGKGAKTESNPAEEAITQAEQSLTDSKPPNKRGIRDRYYVVGAICSFENESDDGETEEYDDIVAEVVKANSEKEARAAFKAMHGIDATMFLDGSTVLDAKGNPMGGCGFYIAMGTGMSSAQKVSVTVTPEQLIRHTGLAFRAKLHIDGRDHDLCGNGLKATKVKMGEREEHFNDNELCSVIFQDMWDGDKKIPKPKLKRCEVVRYSDLKEVQKME